MTRGMVLGKFLPPHAGHLHLVRFAAAMVDELAVVVGSLEREPIPGALRAAWMRELCPTARVLHLDRELPQAPEEHPEFWRLWREALTEILPWPVQRVFASEHYGHRLAAELGARFVPVDPGRTALAISGTSVRADPFAHWRWLPSPVRAFACQRIAIYGPESSGKTTLARDLARHFDTVWVPEYARTALEAGAELSPDALVEIMRGQAASEDALARAADRRLFCDTDPSVTPLWAELLLGATIAEPPPRSYALTLLLHPDVPFVADDVRYRPDQRRAFFDRCRARLIEQERPFVEIAGDFDTRTRQAIAAVERLPPPTLDRPELP